METPEIAAKSILELEIKDPLKCPTCGNKMTVVLVGKVNTTYVTICENSAIKHSMRICTPTLFFPEE